MRAASGGGSYMRVILERLSSRMSGALCAPLSERRQEIHSRTEFCSHSILPQGSMMDICISVTPLSVASDFQCYIHIRPLAVYIVSIKLLFASAFQGMTFAAYLTIMQASPFIQNIIQTFFSCGCFNTRCGHYC